MNAFSREQAYKAVPTLDLSIKAPLRGVLKDYAALFGLDTLAARPGVQHYFGHIEAYGYQIATHVFVPPRARGTLLVLHGYFDHVGLFTHPIQRGLEADYAVVAFDLPGHGLSSGASCDIPDFSHYQEVLRDVMQFLKADLPTSWLAVGQSTGGGILLDHILSSLAAGKRPVFQRVQLWAPLVHIAQWRKIKLSVLLFGRFRAQIPRHFRRSSSDEAFINMLWNQDPLQAQSLPLNWVSGMLRWEKHMQSLPACRFPVTLVQGGRDETVDWRYNVGFVQRHTFLEKLIEIPEASHHLANERADLREQVLSAMDRYLLA